MVDAATSGKGLRSLSEGIGCRDSESEKGRLLTLLTATCAVRCLERLGAGSRDITSGQAESWR